jgi:predicted metal-binding membrane protein
VTEGKRPSSPSLASLLAHEHRIGAACLAALCALAWWWLARMPGPADPPAGGMIMADMVGMASSGPPDVWSLAYLGPAALMWTIMMIAMMLPSASPMILLHAALSRRGDGASRSATIAFALTYMLLWTVFAVLAALGQALLVWSGLLSRMGLVLGSAKLAAALLIAIGLYQASPLKRLCLSRCRSPVQFLMHRWGPGVADAIRMGFAHGAYCIGCCGLLMLLLFVGGVMNLAWVALIALLVLAEKHLPGRLHADRLISAGLLAAALALLAQ